MGRKKKPKVDDEEQYARFVETAKQIQDGDAEKRFEEAVAKILKPKTPKKEAQR